MYHTQTFALLEIDSNFWSSCQSLISMEWRSWFTAFPGMLHNFASGRKITGWAGPPGRSPGPLEVKRRHIHRYASGRGGRGRGGGAGEVADGRHDNNKTIINIY